MVKGVYIESDGVLIKYGSKSHVQNSQINSTRAPWESLLQKNKLTRQKSSQINRSHTIKKRSSTEPLLLKYKSEQCDADNESDG